MRLVSRRASLLLLTFVSIVAAHRAAAQTPPPAWTPELSMTVRRVSAVVPSPDATRVAFVVGEARMDGEKSEWWSQIHVARADGSGSSQLTQGDKSSTMPRWSPDGRFVGFVSARGGARNVWRIPVDGGEAEMITDGKGGISGFEWSPDGASLAFVETDPKTDEEEKAEKEKRDWRTVDANPKLARLYVVPVAKGADGRRVARLLTSGPLHVTAFSWAPDGRTIVFEHQKSPGVNDWPTADISIVSVADGAVRPLASTAAAENDPRYSPDGRWIAFTVSDTPPRWAFSQRVHVVAADGGTPRPLADTPDGQPGIVGWSADGGQVLVSETMRVVNRVLALAVDGKPAAPIGPADLTVDAPALNRTGTAIGFVGQDFDRAPEPFVSPVAPFAPVKAASVQPPFDAPLGRSEAVRWTSADGTSIEGVLTYPVEYRAGARVPLLVIVHGGPTGVFTRTFTGSATQYPVAAFAANGYAVLRCNVRGSSGYGKTFRFANVGDWGGADYRDIMTGVDALVAKGVADPDRLGVMGWSYGGFMTSWIVTQSHRFRAASVGAGVTNLMSFTGTSDIPGFVPDYFGGEYWDVFDAWRAHSAMFNVRGVTTPTLIQHGEADDRVPISQGYEFYNALKRQGVTVRMTVYPRQAHGFTEPRMTLDAARANLEWFNRFVLGRTAPSSASR